MQVVLGCGEEYFASDKNGKLEFKEPEVKKLGEEEGKKKVDRQVEDQKLCRLRDHSRRLAVDLTVFQPRHP